MAFYWREYYEINRRIWPDWNRLAAAWDALRLAVKVWRRGDHSDGSEGGR